MPSPTAAQIGSAIRKLRNEHAGSPSIEALAGEAGIHPTYLSGIERGTGSNPSWSVLTAICDALEVDVQELIRLAATMPSQPS